MYVATSQSLSDQGSHSDENALYEEIQECLNPFQIRVVIQTVVSATSGAPRLNPFQIRVVIQTSPARTTSTGSLSSQSLSDQGSHSDKWEAVDTTEEESQSLSDQGSHSDRPR